MQDILELKPYLAEPRKIIITTHHKPDGDALGSTLALYHYFKLKGQQVQIISPSDYPEFLLWMPGEKSIINFEKEQQRCQELIRECDIIFCLDFNKLSRINDLGKIIGASKKPKVIIDHHPEPDTIFEYSLHRTTACSTTELVYEFINLMGDEKLIDKDIATCIYTGILTDTDRFRVPTTSPLVHRITAHLLECGVNHNEVYQQIYETFPEYKMRFFGFCISERMEIIPDLNTGIIHLDEVDLKKFNIRTGDTEGLVNFPLQIDIVKLAIIIIERPDQVKLSFRSKGKIDVNALARDYFEGGGHRNAAGGKSNHSVLDTKKNLITILARLKNQIFQ